MSKELINKLEAFQKKNKLSTLELCRRMKVYPVTFRRWKKFGRITKSYETLILDFLLKNTQSSKIITTRAPENQYSSDIAVIGIGCYYPGPLVPVNCGRLLFLEGYNLEGCLIKGFL